jgi:hypothetical protein
MNKKKAEDNPGVSPPPVELATTSPAQEMSTPGTAKYMSLQQPDLNAHPAFSNTNSIHSRSPSEAHSVSSPYAPYAHQPSTPTSPAPFPSPYGTDFPQHHASQTNPYPPYSDNASIHENRAAAYDSHGYAQPSPPLQPRPYSFPPPPSPSHPPVAQPQPQVYYPPPPDPVNRSNPSSSEPVASTPQGTHTTTATSPTEPPSTSTTPAHFYAQPIPIRPVLVESNGHGYRVVSDFGDATRLDRESGSVASRGSGDSRKRPVRGKFVEVDPM